MDWIDKTVEYGVPFGLIISLIVSARTFLRGAEIESLVGKTSTKVDELRRDVDRHDEDITSVDSRMGCLEVKVSQIDETLNTIAQGQSDMRRNQNEWNCEIRDQIKELRDQQGRFFQMFTSWSVEMMERNQDFSQQLATLMERTKK